MQTSKKILLTAMGTLGDVFPSIGVGSALQGRGHEVHVLANAYFEEAVRDAGLGFISIGRRENYCTGLEDTELWHPRLGLQAVMRSLMPDIKVAYETLMEHYEPGRTTVVAHPFDFSARLAQEKYGIPCATMVLSPFLFRSLYRVPVMRGARELSSMPRVFKSWMWWLADRYLIDPVVMPGLKGACSVLGRPPVRRPFNGWIFSPSLTIGLFPDWFADPQPDWPSQVRLTGFPLYESALPVPEEVESFLQLPDRPVVFTCGSGLADSGAFIEAVVEACGRIGRRGLLLGRLGDGLRDRVDTGREGFLHVPFAPLGAILGRCAALVHHGGIGTTAAALAAGVPQIVRPQAHDQPDHAARVARLGVGEVLLPRNFTGASLAEVLARVLDDEALASRCVEWANRLSTAEPLSQTCDLIEGLAG